MKLIFPIALLAAVLFSCDHSKITGIVTTSTVIFKALDSNDTLRIVPTGTVLELVEKAVVNKANTPRAKIRLNGTEGYIDRQFIVFAVKPGMMKTFVNYPDGTHFPENGFVVYDSIENDQAHVYYGESSNNAWVSTEDVDLDTANAAVAALVDALDRLRIVLPMPRSNGGFGNVALGMTNRGVAGGLVTVTIRFCWFVVLK